MSGATQHFDGSRKRWKHGKSVVDGEVRFLSVSALEKADPTTGSGCLRRWAYQYLWGIKEDETQSESLVRGNECHGQIAKYYATGVRAFNSIVMRGVHMLPSPGQDIASELDIVPDLPDGRSGLSIAPLRVAGIPVVGAIDLVHSRCENPGVQDIADATDPPGILKIVDFKFPNSLKSAKEGPELIRTLQMAGYAMWGWAVAPDLERIRISHAVIPVRGQPRMPTALVTRDQAEETWKHATAVACSIRDAAKETDPDKIDANTDACHAYGRPCPALVAQGPDGRPLCRAAEFDSLSEYVGVTAAERMLLPTDALIPASSLIRSREGEQFPMQAATPAPGSLFAFVQGAAQPAPQAPPAPQPDLAAEIARLQAQLAATQAPVSMPVPPPPQAYIAPPPAAPPPMHPTIALIEQVRSYGLGFPTLAGFAAGEVGRLVGRVPTPRGTDHFLDGEGELAVHTIYDLNHLPAVLDEVKGIVARRASAPQPVPPAAPAPVPVPPPVPAPLPPPQVVSILPPDAPVSNPAAQVQAPPAAAAPAEEPKKKRGRPAKEPATPASAAFVAAPAPVTAPVITVAPAPESAQTQTVVAVAPPAPPPVAPVQAAPATPSGAINFYVGCSVAGAQCESFWPMLQYIGAEMTRGSGADDYRCASKESKYGFGGWRGVVTAALLGNYAAGRIAPGNYLLDDASGDLAGAALEAMREIASRSGGVFVRGMR